MTDAIDLSHVTIHNSPADVASWTPTRTITNVTLRNDTAPDDQRGFAFAFDQALPEDWKFFPDPQNEPTDNYQFTVWVILRINGVWHTSGFIQMWQGRPATGAPLEEHWADWAYDVTRWGDLVNFPPKAGDAIGLFVTAGNARGQSGVTSVRERSNVVTIVLPLDDAGVFDFAPASTPTPIPSPTPAPAPAPTPTPAPSDADDALIAQFDNDLQQLNALISAVQTDIRSLVQRLDTVIASGVKVHL